MKFQGHNNEHDALNEILRRYMLENNPTGPGGESLMDVAGESVFEGEATVSPSAGREADMLSRLKQNFPDAADAAVPGPATGSSFWKKAGISVGAIALLFTAVLLIFNPFAQDSIDSTNSIKYLASQHKQGLNIAPANEESSVAVEPAKDLSSLLLEDGNLNPSPEKDKGLGTLGGDQRKTNRNPWMSNRNVFSGTKNSDPATVSSNILPRIVAKTDENNARILAKEVMDPFPLKSLYAQTGIQSKYYLVEPDKDHMIKGKKGTLLHIPKDAFVDPVSGEAVREMVQLEIKEVYKRSGFLKTNLPTVSNGRQLVSGGAIYIDATAAGRRLKLAHGKDIYVEFQGNKGVDTRDMDLYHGKYNERGDMNWVPVGGKFTKMLTLPMDKMYFEEFQCRCDDQVLWNLKVYELSDKYYANTWIATREFRERLRALRDMGYYAEGLLIYQDNTDKPLWQVDQMVTDRLSEDVLKRKVVEDQVDVFQRFAQAMLAEIEPFDDHGIDLERWDARRQLMYRSVSRGETERLIRLHKLRKQFADELERSLIFEKHGKDLLAVGPRRGNIVRNIVRSFVVRQLGWSNLTKVVDHNFANVKTRDCKVRLTGEVPYASTNVFLVYSKLNSLVPAHRTTGQLFKFRDVPKNVDAWVVSVGYKNMMPYLGMTKLPKDGKRVSVVMKRMQIDNFMLALKSLD